MSPRVLVADDDPLIRDSLVDVLEDHGYQVSTAADGERALARLRGRQAPAAILLDHMMSVLDGRGLLAGIPVIVITAYGDVASFEDDSVRATLRKPKEMHALLATLGACCAA